MKDYFEKINKDNQLFIKSGLINSNVIFFFVTRLFLKSDKFKEEWSHRGNKVILLILLEELDTHIDLNVNHLFVSDFNESMSAVAKLNTIEKNKIFLSRLVNLSETTLNKKLEKISNKFSSNIYGKISERFTLKHIELINDDEVIIKTL